MAVTSGFFNSVSGDRKYDAEDVNLFFDGILIAGVFSTIGDTLGVVPSTGLQIAVGSGKAWFLNSWLINSSDGFLTLSDADLTYDRIDIIAVDFDKTDLVRANSIIVVEGTPAGAPVPPTLIDTDTHLQMPLSHILVEANETVIQAGDITNKVGTVDCPFAVILANELEADEVSIENVLGILSVKALGVDTAELAADAVTGAKIEDDAINSEHYAAGSIDEEHLASNSVSIAKMKSNSVDTPELVADAVDGTKIANNAINSEHYVDGSIDNVHIGNDQINSEHYANLSIDRAHLANDVIDGSKIANNAINSEHYVDASIDNEHLALNMIDDDNIRNRVPMLTRRQGGSSSGWSSPGVSNYTPTAVKMQAGVKLTDGSIGPGGYDNMTITYPQAFSNIPIVFIQPGLVDFHHGFLSINASAFTIQIKNDGPDAAQPSIHWLAIGPE